MSQGQVNESISENIFATNISLGRS